MKKTLLTLSLAGGALAVSAQTGIGTTTPTTTLDVNGAFTNREAAAIAVTGNTTIANLTNSQFRLTGTPAASFTITPPTTSATGVNLVAGARMIIYNATTQTATLNGNRIPAGQALEFAYSNGTWQANNGGYSSSNAANTPNIYTSDGTLLGNRRVTRAGNTLSITNTGIDSTIFGSAPGLIVTRGASSAILFSDRSRPNVDNGIYTDAGVTRIWNTKTGDVLTVDSLGNTTIDGDLNMSSSIPQSINMTFADGNKLNMVGRDTGSRITHASGWNVQYYAGLKGGANIGQHQWYTTDSAGRERLRMNLANNGTLALNTNLNSNSLHSFSNSSTGSDAMGGLQLNNNTASAFWFLNSSTRTTDGGPNTATLRNDAGALRLQGNGGKGITVAPTTGNVVTDGTVQINNLPSNTGTVMLTADNNGVVSKQALPVASAPTIFANVSPTGINLTAANNTNYTYTGTSITIPANSRYIVQVYQLLIPNSTAINTPIPAGQSLWVRSTFMDNTTGGATASADIVGSPLVSGVISSDMNFNMMSGAITINNTSNAAKTYYYSAGLVVSNNFAGTLYYFGSSTWGENQIYAIPTR
jgi:hypothetical protein